MTQNQKHQNPAWDLSDLYNGIKDPKIEQDLEKYRKSAVSFARKYKGKLATLSDKEFLQVLKAKELFL